MSRTSVENHHAISSSVNMRGLFFLVDLHAQILLIHLNFVRFKELCARTRFAYAYIKKRFLQMWRWQAFSSKKRLDFAKSIKKSCMKKNFWLPLRDLCLTSAIFFSRVHNQFPNESLYLEKGEKRWARCKSILLRVNALLSTLVQLHYTVLPIFFHPSIQCSILYALTKQNQIRHNYAYHKKKQQKSVHHFLRNKKLWLCKQVTGSHTKYKGG